MTKGTQMQKLSPLQELAASKAKCSSAARNAVNPGEHGVDFLLRVSGTVKVGEDHEQRIVAKADPWTLLAAALSHLNGVTVDSLTREALEADPELVKSIKAQAKDSIEACKEATMTPCKGKVTTKLSYEVVSYDSERVA
jgi:hypothetical protein